ncbi:MAG: hypothetical protein HYX84_02530 [Chloroflexi bacterium]|nr:hypothetical protein [Chloroflexota bacterium]
MSTRGAIARQKGDTFEGRYHHWDSYPTGLGKALWDVYHEQFQDNLDEMLRVLIDEHPAGWSSIVGKDFAVTPGYNDYGKGNCLKCGRLAWEHYYQDWESHGKKLTAKARKDMANGRYMALEHPFEGPESNNAECYCHGDRHEEAFLVTEENAAGSGCEYAYVFAENGKLIMTILSSLNEDESKMIGMFGMGNPEAKWGVLAIVPLDGPEPDWKNIERGS